MAYAFDETEGHHDLHMTTAKHAMHCQLFHMRTAKYVMHCQEACIVIQQLLAWELIVA